MIEDDFKAGRPALEQVGVQFTDDVSPYETAKLRLLNGSHLMMGFIGYLAGYTRVDNAIKDPVILQLVNDYMTLDAAPTPDSHRRHAAGCLSAAIDRAVW